MKLTTIMGIGIAAFILMWALLFTVIHMAIEEVDESGGLKALTERVWEGKPIDD